MSLALFPLPDILFVSFCASGVFLLCYFCLSFVGFPSLGAEG